MDLTGIPLLVLLGVSSIGAPVALMLLWNRVPGALTVRIAQRAGLILACQLSAVLLVAAVVNDYFSLYDSWSDLFGTGDTVSAAGPEHAAGGAGGVPSASDIGAHAGQTLGSRVLSEQVTGARSGITTDVWLILPPATGRRPPGTTPTRSWSSCPGTPASRRPGCTL